MDQCWGGLCELIWWSIIEDRQAPQATVISTWVATEVKTIQKYNTLYFL